MGFEVQGQRISESFLKLITYNLKLATGLPLTHGGKERHSALFFRPWAKGLYSKGEVLVFRESTLQFLELPRSFQKTCGIFTNMFLFLKLVIIYIHCHCENICFLKLAILYIIYIHHFNRCCFVKLKAIIQNILSILFNDRSFWSYPQVTTNFTMYLPNIKNGISPKKYPQ